METVNGNKALFTKQQLAGAEKARQLYISLLYPSMNDFLWILWTNRINDCPVTVRDAEVALKVWGPNIAALKGKTTHKVAKSVKVEDLVEIPKEMIAMHKNVTLGIDIFFVNKIPFFVTLSCDICFICDASVRSETSKYLRSASWHVQLLLEKRVLHYYGNG